MQQSSAGGTPRQCNLILAGQRSICHRPWAPPPSVGANVTPGLFQPMPVLPAERLPPGDTSWQRALSRVWRNAVERVLSVGPAELPLHSGAAVHFFPL